MWNSAATCAIGRPLASTWSTARRLPTAVSGALRWGMERVSSQQMNGFSTTHRAGQGPVPSSPLRDYNVMTRNIYPLVYSFAISLTQYSGMQTPTFIGLQNYVAAFLDPLVRTSVGNTVYYMLIAVPLGLVVALLLAL